MKILNIVALVLFAGVVLAKDYTGYKFVQVFPNSEENSRLIAKWEIENTDIDVWNQAREVTSPVDILLSPEAFEKYTGIFHELGMSYSVIHPNVQDLIDRERSELAASRMEGRVVNTYARHTAILNWLDATANANPSFVSTYSAGKSNQGRDLTVLKISVGNPAKRIWFDCGIHAREWISPATCISLINKFIDDYNKNDAAATNILRKYELHFLPVLNPDGYEYSHTTDRYWRKNRKVNPGSTCLGVDLNRNFPFQWLTGGASTDPCSDTHAGPSAGSEPEAKAVIDALSNGNWAAYYTLHSYGNWFLTSYGHTNALPPDYTVQKATGDKFATAVAAVNGEVFTVGSTANLLYIASGASSDYGYGVKGIVHSYTIELRPRNGFGVFGFVLAENQIGPVGNEIYAGVKTLINEIP